LVPLQSILAVVLVGAALALPAQTEAVFSVGPTVADVSLRPGEAAAGTTRVRVAGERGSRFTIEVEDIAQRPDGGLAYAPPDGSRHSASSWIDVRPRTFGGRRDRVQPIEYRIRVPRDAEPGDHVTSLTVKRQPPAAKAGIATVQAVSVRVTVRVIGELVERVKIESLDVPRIAGRGPVTVGATLRNRGNVRLDFERGNRAALEILDGDEERARLPLKGFLLPGKARSVELAWDDPPLLGQARAALTVATRDGQVTASAAFWLIPWRQAGALALVVVAALTVVGGRRRIRRTV
jgi:hypothetical protein